MTAAGGGLQVHNAASIAAAAAANNKVAGFMQHSIFQSSVRVSFIVLIFEVLA